MLARPCGYVLIELMSDQQSLLREEELVQTHARMTFSHWNDGLEPDDLLTPLRVSRAVSSPGLVDKAGLLNIMSL